MRSFLARLSTGNKNRSPEPPSSGFQNGHTHDSHDLFRPTTSTGEWSAEFASDPAEWETEFMNCWGHLKGIIVWKPGRSEKVDQRDTFSEVKTWLHNMCKYLVMEITSQPEPIIGPILEHCFNDDIFWHLHKWATKTPLAMVPRCQVMLLETYGYLIDGTQSNSHYLLIHKPILIPLLRLLAWCQRTSRERRVPASEVDKYFVRLLNQICKKISEESNLLELFFNSQMTSEWEPVQDADGRLTAGDDEDGPFLVFRLLIAYVHAANDVGQLARDALLQIMCVSRRFYYVAKHVAESEFCAVLATGLSGFWSQLPMCIYSALQVVDLDEFHKLNPLTDLDGSVPELVEFQKALLFCNAVVQDAHGDVRQQIIHFFYDGFLCRVVKAAVEQLDDEELVSIIVYIHLCFDTVTEECLIQALLKVLIVADTSSRDMNLLEVILSRMNDNEKLCRVVLSFLRTLLELRCEDLMWSCLLRFIIPFIPLKATRRFDVNVSLNAAEHFLGCIPQCTKSVEELNSNEVFQIYLKEAAAAVQEATLSCKSWAFKYNGIKPNALLNMNPPEELLTTRQPFIRLSSARSSFASNGLNRYFQNRFAHGTQDSLLINDNASVLNGGMEPLPPLNRLGEDDSRELMRIPGFDKIDSLLDSGLDDFNDFSSQYDLTADNNIMHDYFHFTYEGISSESDEMNNSRRNSTSDDGLTATTVTTVTVTTARSGVIANESVVSPFVRAVRTADWTSVANDTIAFCKILDTLPSPSTTVKPISRANGYTGGIGHKYGCGTMEPPQPSLEENVALIEARFQYISELNADATTLLHGDVQQSTSSGFVSGAGAMGTSGSTTTSLPRPTSGLLLTCTDEKGSGLFLESLFSALEKLVDRSFTTNLQLLGVLNVLMSYPQPVITCYLLYIDTIKSNALLRITNILENLKSRIDAFASSTDGFEDMIRRGVQHKNIRAERFEKSVWMTPNPSSVATTARLSVGDSATPLAAGGAYSNHLRRVAFSARNSPLVAASSARVFRHKIIESHEHCADALRTRNFAYAAILLSQLCQTCAAFALQHNTPPLFNHATSTGAGGGISFSVASTPGR